MFAGVSLSTCDMCMHQGKNSIHFVYEFIIIDIDLALIEGGWGGGGGGGGGEGGSQVQNGNHEAVCVLHIGLSLCSKSCKLQETAIELRRRLSHIER